jgi:hypothetical protein
VRNLAREPLCLQSEAPGPFEAEKEWVVGASLTEDKERNGESVV